MGDTGCGRLCELGTDVLGGAVGASTLGGGVDGRSKALSPGCVCAALHTGSRLLRVQV